MKNMNLQVINAQLLPIFVIGHLRAIGNGLFINNILFYNQFVVSFESRSFYYFINIMTSYDTRYLNRRDKTNHNDNGFDRSSQRFFFSGAK